MAVAAVAVIEVAAAVATEEVAVVVAAVENAGRFVTPKLSRPLAATER